MKPLYELISLSLVSFFGMTRSALAVYAWFGYSAKVGLKSDLRTALDSHDLDVSAKRLGNAVWLLVFLWEFIWTAYAWTCLCHNPEVRAIFPGIYPLYAFACAINIGWIFAEGNNVAPLSFALSVVLCIVLYISLGAAAFNLYRKKFDLQIFNQRNDLRATHVLVLNGIALYAAWATITMLYDLGAMLQDTAHVHHVTVGTIILSLLGSLLLAYFVFEVTIFDCCLRYVLIVYPVVIWTLTTVLVKQWSRGINRNVRLSLITLSVAVLLFFLRICSMAIFGRCRRIRDAESSGSDYVPY